MSYFVYFVPIHLKGVNEIGTIPTSLTTLWKVGM